MSIFFEYLDYIQNARAEIWISLVSAFLIETMLVTYLRSKNHLNLAIDNNSRWILCVQWNDVPKGCGYRMPGAAAVFSAGIPQWLAHYLPGLEWLNIWALVGLWLTIFATILLAWELMRVENSHRLLIAKSHGLFWDPCAQVAVLDPLGLVLFAAAISPIGQVETGVVWVRTGLKIARNFLALPHTLVGAIVMIIIFNPMTASILSRKPRVVLAIPVAWKVFK